jgi:hypothetical protein
VRPLLVKANVPSSPIPVTLMMEALSSSETSAFARATRRNFPEDAAVNTSNLTQRTTFFELPIFCLQFKISLKRLNTICHVRMGDVRLAREMFPLILNEAEQFVN